MTLGPTIDATGISAPAFETILSTMTATIQNIVGADAYLADDSMDGQIIGVVCAAVDDCNGGAIATYNAYRPSGAQGTGLSSMVKINGIKRDVSSPSQVLQQVVGTVYTVITNGYVIDESNIIWNLPASVEIPLAGEITVTATCSVQGSTTAATGTITKIGNPQFGWLSTANIADATPGDPIETDGVLRARQAISTAEPAETVLVALVGDIAAISGVTRYRPYENDTDTTDGNGMPPHSIGMVVEGGDAQTIANTIAAGKGPGAATVGNVSETVVDAAGIPHTIRYYTPTEVPVTVAITLQGLTGYVSTTGTAINAAIVAYINALPIGTPVYLSRLIAIASAQGPTVNGQAGGTYDILTVETSRGGGGLAAANVTIAFTEAASCATNLVTVTAS